MATTIEPRDLVGLCDEDVIARQAAEGFNELPQARKRTVFHIAFEVVREPMFLLLVACGAHLPAARRSQEALMLLGFVFVVIGITLYQERKTERALEALRDLSSPRALVIRDGQRKTDPGPGGGTRRHHRPCRGRPGARRRAGAPGRAALSGRRIAADRRIGAGAESRVGRRPASRHARAATTCRSSTRARWWCRARASRR